MKKKAEFSKVLAIIITMLFVASIIFVFAVWYFENRLGTEILSYVATPFGVVISGYFAKAGFENHGKINNAGKEIVKFNNEEEYYNG